MKHYTHGGDIYTAGERYEKVYDFSANINPLGMPKEAETAAARSLSSCEHYPDPLCRRLTEKISAVEKVKSNQVVCGNGAADLIFRLALALRPGKSMVCAPTFSEYEQGLKSSGSQVVYHILREEEGFHLTEDILLQIEAEDGLDLLFLCNPNNPVGDLTDRTLMERILSVCRDKDIIVVVDECFMDLTGKAEAFSLTGKLSQYENLMILKAFTKSYAMAGLRLGYLLSANEELLDKVFAFGQPWSVSTPAQEAGRAALCTEGYLKKALILISREKKRLCQALRGKGFRVFPPEANYIFFFCEKGEQFRTAMAEKGILIRSCGNYPGLSENFLRIAVRTPEENDYFIQMMEELDLWQKQ